MKAITFCIASANNEKEYTKLLLKSLKDHTQLEKHEILIFIDSDNQGTYEALLELQKDMPMMRLCKNPNDWPIGSQRNVSIMFNKASNDIVCYLQSDMVVGKNFDKHVSLNLTDENVVLSCARIEPPLHPGSPEKIVKDFGIVPEEFQYDNFNKFVDELQKENRPNMVGHFAPFAIYKSTWFDKLGGFDTQFRCSREDSDMIIRMELLGLNMIQSWNACVYHFTCVSSRGKDWFKKDQEADYKNALQQNADFQELKRFIRKWGFFGHHPKPVYNVTFNIDIDRFVDVNVLKWLEPYCKKMYLSDAAVASQLASQLDFESNYFSNLRLNYTPSRWKSVQHLFNPTDFQKKIRSLEFPVEGDVVISFKYSEIFESKDSQHFIENIHEIVHNNEEGEFEWGPFTIQIKNKHNLVHSYKRVDSIDLLLNEQNFNFT
jgi:GT2 family glycosyltransferase